MSCLGEFMYREVDLRHISPHSDLGFHFGKHSIKVRVEGICMSFLIIQSIYRHNALDCQKWQNMYCAGRNQGC